jgi:hypothetical protein
MVGTCADFGDIPDYIITKYYEGLQKIERYCAKCLTDQTTIDKNKKRDSNILSKEVVDSVNNELTKRQEQQEVT